MAFDAGSIVATLEVDRSAFLRGLQQARADAERFERRKFEATLDADTQPAKRRVGGLVGQLERVARKRTSAAVDVDVVGDEKIERLRRQLVAIPDRDIEVRVHVDRARGAIDNILRALGSPMVAAVASLVAIAPAAVAAAGAIGGIGVAAMSILPAFGLLGAGMMLHFKNGGASAKALTDEIGHLKGALENATGPAARAAFSGLTEGLQDFRRMLPTLREDFTGLGGAVGIMFRQLGQFAASADMVEFYKASIKGATAATKPLTDIIKALGSVFANVAQAGMPLFIEGLEKMAKWLGEMADKTDNIGKLRASMREGAKAAGQFWQVVKNLGGVLKSIWEVGKQPSADLLGAFVRGTAELDRFFKTAEGRDILRKTLESMVFFAEELLQALPTLIEIFGELLDIGRFLWNAVKGITDVIKEIPVIGGPVAAMFLGWAALLGPMGLIRVGLGAIWKMLGMIGASKALASLVGAVGLGGIARRMPGGRQAPAGGRPPPAVVPAPINTRKADADAKRAGRGAGRSFVAGKVAAIAAGASAVLAAARRLVGRLGPALRRIPRLGAIAGVIAAAFTRAGPRVLRGIRGIPGKVGGLLKKIPGLGAIAGIIGGAFGKSKGKVDDAVKKVGPSAGRILKGAGRIAARGVFGWPGLIAAVIWSVLPDKLKESIKKAASAAWGEFKNAGSSLMSAIGQGISAAAGKVVNGVRWVIRQAKRLLPGSEPEDTSSPLYGLGRSGAAIPENMAAGVRASTAKLRDAVVKLAEEAYAPTRQWAQGRLGALDASDKAHAPKPPTRAEQVAAIQGRINQARYATDERGVPIHARPPGVARVKTAEERELLHELWALRRSFEREDLEATANLTIEAMIPSDPRVLREIQRSLGRSVRQGRRRRPRKARMA